MPGRIPVTIITGRLGAGKTTLLNRLLAANRRRPNPRALVVVENEFAMEYGVEEQLLLPPSDDSPSLEQVHEVFDFGTSCLCCSSFAQFLSALRSIGEGGGVDHVLVETTGLAGGGPAGTGWAPVFDEPGLAARFQLWDVVAIVDAAHFADDVDDPDRPAVARNETAEQVSIASVVILNKADLVSPTGLTLEDLEARLRQLNPNLRCILRAVDAAVDTEALLMGGLGVDVPIPAAPACVDHDTTVKAHCIVHDGDFDEAAVRRWLQHVADSEPGLLRSKGVIPILGAARRLLLQGVRRRVDARWGAEWAGEERLAKLVLIGRRLDFPRLTADFVALCPRTGSSIPVLSGFEVGEQEPGGVSVPYSDPSCSAEGNL